MTTPTKRTEFSWHALLAILLFLLIEIPKCNRNLIVYGIDVYQELEEHYDHIVSEKNDFSPNCESVYRDYLRAVENFTHCEISYVRPFRLCLTCNEQFQSTKEFYTNLTSNPEHVECKTKYMMSDRVQIIPTVQTDIEKMWRTSHCHKCYAGRKVLHEKVVEFLSLYRNFSACVGAPLNEDFSSSWIYGGADGNTSDICTRCKKDYTSLNANFNSMYDAYVGDVCMDIMDMMNYTRIKWSSQFNCTHSSKDPTPVIVISCLVACTPVLFYVYLRVTGKVRGARLFKPKRLQGSTDVSSASHHTANSPHSAH